MKYSSGKQAELDLNLPLKILKAFVLGLEFEDRDPARKLARLLSGHTLEDLETTVEELQALYEPYTRDHYYRSSFSDQRLIETLHRLHPQDEWMCRLWIHTLSRAAYFIRDVDAARQPEVLEHIKALRRDYPDRADVKEQYPQMLLELLDYPQNGRLIQLTLEALLELPWDEKPYLDVADRVIKELGSILIYNDDNPELIAFLSDFIWRLHWEGWVEMDNESFRNDLPYLFAAQNLAQLDESLLCCAQYESEYPELYFSALVRHIAAQFKEEGDLAHAFSRLHPLKEQAHADFQLYNRVDLASTVMLGYLLLMQNAKKTEASDIFHAAEAYMAQIGFDPLCGDDVCPDFSSVILSPSHRSVHCQDEVYEDIPVHYMRILFHLVDDAEGELQALAFDRLKAMQTHHASIFGAQLNRRLMSHSTYTELKRDLSTFSALPHQDSVIFAVAYEMQFTTRTERADLQECEELLDFMRDLMLQHPFQFAYFVFYAEAAQATLKHRLKAGQNVQPLLEEAAGFLKEKLKDKRLESYDREEMIEAYSVLYQQGALSSRSEQAVFFLRDAQSALLPLGKLGRDAFSELCDYVGREHPEPLVRSEAFRLGG